SDPPMKPRQTAAGPAETRTLVRPEPLRRGRSAVSNWPHTRRPSADPWVKCPRHSGPLPDAVARCSREQDPDRAGLLILFGNVGAYVAWTPDHGRIEPVTTGHSSGAPDPRLRWSGAPFRLVNDS